MTAVLCMIGYCTAAFVLRLVLTDSLRSFFAFDIANRVEHERQLIVSPAYIAIDIPLGTLSSIADGILQIWLLTASPVNIQEGPVLAKVAMITAIVIYWIISFVCKGTQIWALVQQITPNFIHSLANGDKKTAEGLTLGFEIYQDLNTAASGMMLLFSIGFAIFSFNFVRRRYKGRSDKQYNRVTVAIGTLAVVFLARNAVMFTFTLVYSQFNHIAPPGIQLVYFAFYDILSVGVYICISQAVKSQPEEDPLARAGGLGQLQQHWSPEGGAGWERAKPQANVSNAPYMYQNSYGSYRYEPMASTSSR